MPHRVALLPGDGIGPEVTEAALRVIEAAGVPVQWIPCQVGRAAEEKAGVPLPAAVLETVREVGMALKGPVTTPIGTGRASVNVALRRGLDLCVWVLASEFPEVRYQELIIDNACMQLVLNPHQFDVLVMENFYGDLVSDLGAGLVGGLGAVPGVNLGDEVAVFEAIHGDAPHLAGKGLASPLPLLVSAILMLRHLGEAVVADRVTAAVARVLAEGRAVTPDLGGHAGTREMAEAIIAAL